MLTMPELREIELPAEETRVITSYSFWTTFR